MVVVEEEKEEEKGTLEAHTDCFEAFDDDEDDDDLRCAASCSDSDNALSAVGRDEDEGAASTESPTDLLIIDISVRGWACCPPTSPSTPPPPAFCRPWQKRQSVWLQRGPKS